MALIQQIKDINYETGKQLSYTVSYAEGPRLEAMRKAKIYSTISEKTGRFFEKLCFSPIEKIWESFAAKKYIKAIISTTLFTSLLFSAFFFSTFISIYATISLASLLLLMMSLSLLARNFRPNFTYLYNATADKHEEKHDSELTITSWNVALLPDRLVASNGLRPSTIRSKEIAAHLLQNQSDILLLQEVFGKTEAENLLEGETGLSSAYPHIICNVGSDLPGVNSGLTIASKYPISEVRFLRFPQKAASDALSDKGCLFVKIRLPNDTFKWIATTHLQATYDDKMDSATTPKQKASIKKLESVRNEQAKTLSHYLEQNPDIANDLILGGDLNVASSKQLDESQEERKDNEMKTFQDSLISPQLHQRLTLHVTKDITTAEKENGHIAHCEQNLDHFLLSQSYDIGRPTVSINDKISSDHKLLQTILKLL